MVEEEETEGGREGQEREDDDTVKKDEEMLSTLTCNGHSCTPVGGLGCVCQTNKTYEPDYWGWVDWLSDIMTSCLKLPYPSASCWDAAKKETKRTR